MVFPPTRTIASCDSAARTALLTAAFAAFRIAPAAVASVHRPRLSPRTHAFRHCTATRAA
eukprot:scaffold26215_cov107-Isochrysis_galbana.AAC.8